MADLNLEADSNGCIPKGAKSVGIYTTIKDSQSFTADSFIRLRADAATENYGINDASGKSDTDGTVGDVQSRGSIWQGCDSSGDIDVQLEAGGSGTLDIDIFEYKGVELR
jgi:hypothetical protein